MASDPHRSFVEAVRCPEGEIDLGRAALAIAQGEYPELKIEPYLARIDRLAAAAQARSGGDPDPIRLLASINYVLFIQEGFCGSRWDYYDPKNSFINDVIERKRGIPISLSVLYMEVARRIGLDLEGVGFPGHFLVKYAGGEGEIVIDPFDKGEVRSDEELQELLDRIYCGKTALRPEHLAPSPKRQIIKRMLNNLKAIYLYCGDVRRGLSVVERLVILEPGSPQEVRDRGLFYLQMERHTEALEDLENYLKVAGGAEDAEAIRARVASLKKRLAQLQ